MAIINNTHKFIFFHIPKTGGTSVASYYSAISTPIDIEIGGTSFGEALQPHYSRRFGVGKHCTAQRMRHVLGQTTYDNYWKFCFTRNPFSRTVSTFNFLQQWLPRAASKGHAQAKVHLKTFRRFNSLMDMLESSYWQQTDGIAQIFKPQSFWICGEDGELLIDFVGSIEKIEDDIAKINDHLCLDLPRFNVSKNTSGRNHMILDLNEKGIDLIRHRYAADFAFFEYSDTPE